MSPTPKKPLAEIIAEVQAYFAPLRRGDSSWTDELISERREEARREVEEDE
jgi:hypothetical protein